VDSNNTQDALVLCSTAAPLCDAGYSGKCIELADDAKQPLALSPSESALVLGMLLQWWAWLFYLHVPEHDDIALGARERGVHPASRACLNLSAYIITRQPHIAVTDTSHCHFCC
jgi:hypothetical protein